MHTSWCSFSFSFIFSGRTESFSSYVQPDAGDIAGGVHIRHLDIISLYPNILKYCKMPVGHPEVLRDVQLPNNGTRMGVKHAEEYFGIWSASLYPPEKLNLPVLPIKGKRLIFGLCGTCVKTASDNPHQKNDTYCTHSREERVIKGHFCSPEIVLALKQGYRVRTVTTSVAAIQCTYVHTYRMQHRIYIYI